ncbi:transcription antitermination factor NusB [Patescibacteria group bacterium]|nr:transcription antitermination factor NusB [Patescibacteria group bacterium]
MKNPLDPRHQKRQKLIEDLFRVDFHKQRISSEAAIIMSKKQEIDTQIEKAAPDFPIDKINRVDLAILRLAVYELLIKRSAPPKVIIDEAVELAKEYGGDTSPAFVNGALGKIINNDKNS